MAHPTPVPPKPGQESVWDYPRPPALERVDKALKIVFRGETIAETTKGWRVLETSHPPVYYFPVEDVRRTYVEEAAGSSFCEWKGHASYVDVVVAGERLERVGWYYATPTPRFEELAGAIAFYCAPMDACYVGDEQATPQPGGFYGGWVTSDVVGPFKGGPGSWGW
ncbi:MAG: DUF427 domain-containing protein [Myxococcota bacterium]